MELGLEITQEQIDELKANQDDINYDVAVAREKKLDTMLCLMFTLTDSSALKQQV